MPPDKSYLAALLVGDFASRITARVVLANKVFHLRRNFATPFAAVEDAVMSDTLLQMIFLHSVRKFRRDIQRRFGLANPRNVVQFALNAKERRIGNIFITTGCQRCTIFPLGSAWS